MQGTHGKDEDAGILTYFKDDETAMRAPARRTCLDICLVCYSVAIRHNQKAVFLTDRFNYSINIPVFPDMMARNRRTNPFFTPTILWFIDASESHFIPKYQAYCGIVETF